MLSNLRGHGLCGGSAGGNNQLDIVDDDNDIHRYERDRLRQTTHPGGRDDSCRRKRPPQHHNGGPCVQQSRTQQFQPYHHVSKLPSALQMDILADHQAQHRESTIWRRRFPEASWRSPKLHPSSCSFILASNQDDNPVTHYHHHHHRGQDL
ncbi:hypothetical protein H310_01964 [Aphanomyces invadans]|uniref:Uncharacterized protein n=1 Tax=Aphanomyces invadans TaxID=157072 RepID=A0A024ULZ8_9STRA|nr:hypothetical protein H310_01964 [Aphanomyces invadans]ETW07451.1 hypothetical protein H310_01964 [Aphanomyces invadans]|eukprot:XP_008863544.1 hypothetical protein H310_01964 [Aphanomyces invadans]